MSSSMTWRKRRVSDVSLLSAYISIFIVGVILDRTLMVFEGMRERRRRKIMGDWILVKDN